LHISSIFMLSKTST